MPHDVFISYKTKDRAEAEKVCGHLESDGFSCWMAPRDVLPGEDYGAEIVKAIHDCSVLVLIFSAAANSSKDVARELKLADAAGKIVLPVRIEDVPASGSFAYFLGAAQWLEAVGGIREEHLRRLAAGLRRRLRTAGEVRVNAPEAPAVVEAPPPPVSKPAVPPHVPETKPDKQVRPADEGERRNRVSWTGVAAGYAVAAVALVVLGVIGWRLLHPSTGGNPSGATGPPASGPPGPSPMPITDSKIRTQINSVDGLTYVFLPPGEFPMGCSPDDSECDSGEKKPPHTERIANGFWLCRTEVTQAAWAKVKGGNPSYFKGDQLPVEQVNWTEAGEYCKAIGGRLPTEREWEYAARAGTTGARYGPFNAVAWYSGNSDGTHPVGQKQANAFGLYDMLGNVREWTSDDYGPGQKVVRGGSWYDGSRSLRASVRNGLEPAERYIVVGFRCVREFR